MVYVTSFVEKKYGLVSDDRSQVGVGVVIRDEHGGLICRGALLGSDFVTESDCMDCMEV